MTVVKLKDCVRGTGAGYCVKGIREHCKLIGVDFRRLHREGIPVEELDGKIDQIVENCIRKAKERETRDGE